MKPTRSERGYTEVKIFAKGTMWWFYNGDKEIKKIGLYIIYKTSHKMYQKFYILNFQHFCLVLKYYHRFI